MTSKPCSKCGVVLPASPEFFHRGGGRDGLVSACKPCSRAAVALRYSADPEAARARCQAYRRANPDVVRVTTFNSAIRAHGISVERYHEMIESQQGRCGLCGVDRPGGKGRWHIDHDHGCCPGVHSCGACIRALLCSTCNTGLGKFGDDAARLRAAADYIDRHTKKEVRLSV